MELHHLEHPETGKRHEREVVVHPGAVIILAITDDQQVLLIRNRRYAVDEILLELPAGTIEGDEPPMNCAGRELLEEAGYLAGKLTPLASFYTSPGILSEKMHAFVATKLEKAEQALEEGEDIEVVPTPLQEAIDMAASGEIRDGKTIATLLMYAARR
jgi:ADP-ribose pyrophosphatase